MKMDCGNLYQQFIDYDQINQRFNDAANGDVKLLYVSPERLDSGYLNRLVEPPIDLVAIEAYCISAVGA